MSILFKKIFILNSYPALFLGICAAIGAEASLQNFPFLLVVIFILICFFSKTYSFRICLASTSLLAYAFTENPINISEITETGLVGKAKISIEHLSLISSPYGLSYIYRGKISSFDGNQKLNGIPYYFSFPAKKKDRPPANSDYEVLCRIKKGKGNQVILKPIPHAEWVPKGSFSLCEIRFKLKQQVKKWIEKQFTTPSTAQFISGLVIGEFDDRNLRQDFSRFGLLHLLAISGFHFSIFASLLNFLLRPFLEGRNLTLALIIVLSLYFLFLGFGPSILRAFSTILIYLGAYFHERFSSPINSLGASLLLATFLDPFLLENLGFQFSFLTTGAILFGCKPFSSFFDRIFPKRPFETVESWPLTDQFSYILLGFIKNGLSLSLATSCAALPISLYYFETFPILSLIYNIFFPFLVSISMSFFLFGTILFFIPYFSKAIHLANDYFTSFILNMTYDVPKSFDFTIEALFLPPVYATILCLILFTVIIYSQKDEKELNYLRHN